MTTPTLLPTAGMPKRAARCASSLVRTARGSR